jgi:hypothetical protein
MQVWLCVPVEGCRNGLGHGNYPVFRCDRRACDVLVFEESRPGDSGCSSGGQQEFPTSIVLEGGTQEECLSAVLRKCASHLGSVVDECFHADGYKRVFVVVVMAIYVCVCGN